MNILKKLLLGFSGEEARKNTDFFTSAVIVAAGKSVRTGGSVPKQLIEINGIPVIAHTLIAFERCPVVKEIVIVCREGEDGIYAGYKEKYGISKLVRTVTGGSTRHDSIMHGFSSVSEKSDFVAFHDGARCLIRPHDIEKVVREAYFRGAAIATEKSTDTLKIIDSSGKITGTADRDSVLRAQTPQVFSYDIFAVISSLPEKDGLKITDESILAENAGIPVYAVDIGPHNMKITVESDFLIASEIIERNC